MLEAAFREHRDRSKERCRQVLHAGGGVTLCRILPGLRPAVYDTFREIVNYEVAKVYFFGDHANKCATAHLRNVHRRCPDLQRPDPVRTLVMATHPRLGAFSPARRLPADVFQHIDSFLPTQRDLIQTIAVAANLAFWMYTD